MTDEEFQKMDDEFRPLLEKYFKLYGWRGFVDGLGLLVADVFGLDTIIRYVIKTEHPARDKLPRPD